MTRDDDRDYWRREDARREQRDRDFWRDYDRQRDFEREDREYEARRREERHADGWRALRDGNTVEALRNIAGPDAALGYLRATGGDGHDSRRWTQHAFVTELSELIDNVEQAPAAATFDVGQPDFEGDIPVGVVVGERTERFWVRRLLLATLSPRTQAAAPRTRAVIVDLVAQRGDGAAGMPVTWLGLSSLLSERGRTSDRRAQRLPHTIVDSLRELVDNVAAWPDAEFAAQGVDQDGDGVVEVGDGRTTERFYVRAPLLAQLSALAAAPQATVPLLRALGQLRTDTST